MIRIILIHALCLASGLLDARTTRIGVTNGAAELNLFPRAIVMHRHAWYCAKAGINVWAIVEAEKMRRRGAKQWYLPEMIGTGIQSTAATLNTRGLRRNHIPSDGKLFP